MTMQRSDSRRRHAAGVMSTLSAFALILALMLSSCHDSVTDVNNPPVNPTGQKGGITGKVHTTTGGNAYNVQVSVGSLTTYTDSKGEFYLADVPVADRVVVSFTSASHAFNQKITVVKPGRVTFVEATMAGIGVTQSFSATTGATVQTQGAKVAIPSNAIVDSRGAAYTGTVQMQATWFDPSGPLFTGCFPGEFSGVRTDNSVTDIESFGFMTVELRNGTEKLQLAPGAVATLTFPVPSTMRAKAPATIPLWYYDETAGKWVEQGTATLTGTTYVGTVSHFSSWNCDQPTQTSFLEGRVVDRNGTPLSFARVQSSGVDYTGASVVHTDDNGYFRLPVKSASQAKVWAGYYLASSTPATFTTPATGGTLNIGTITVPIDSMSVCTVIGRVIDNGGLPVKYCSIALLDSTGKSLDFVQTSSGSFKFFCEVGRSYTIVLYGGRQDTMTNTRISFTCPGTAQTVDLGTITLDIGGSTIVGRVVDASSNPIPKAYLYSSESSNPNSGGSVEMQTDSLGRFSLWVRPNKTFDVHIIFNKLTKVVSMTSGNLGETKNVGDITLP